MSFKELMPGVLYLEKCMHLLEVYRIPSTVLCEIPWAREVSIDAKRTLLSLSRDTLEAGEEILQKLSRIDPWGASQFGIKTLAVQDFVMRLLYESSTQDALQQEGSSFIILSYTWHNVSWICHPSLGCPSKDTRPYAQPLTPAMWSAFLSQRLSSSEGFWCDQLCIEQKSEHEKVSAIGAMDLLYKSARKVVVALEDIAITKPEMDALVGLSEQSVFIDPNSHSDDQSQQQARRVARAFGKIVQARWFGRAWCVHEFLVSRNHTFLIPVYNDIEDGVVTIVRLDALFMNRVASMFIKVERSLKRSLLATPDVTHQDHYPIERFMVRLTALAAAEAFETELVNNDGSYMHMVSQIFSLGAFMMSDKLSILLNVMSSGLYYKGSKSMTEEDCYRLATVVALASGDPTALTTNGGPVHLPHSKPETQWLRKPISTDSVQPAGLRSFPKVSTDLAMTEKGLQLDMQFLCTSVDATSAEYKYLSIARWLIDYRAMCKRPPSEQAFPLWLDLIDSKDTSYMAIRVYYIQALACALQLGADWIFEVEVKLYANGPQIQLREDESLKQVYKFSIDFALSLESDDDLGPDMRETWGANDQVNTEDGEEPSLHNAHRLSDDDTLTSGTFAESAEEELIRYEEEDQPSPRAYFWHWFLLRFTQNLVVTGLAVENDKSNYVAAYTATEFAVQILHLSSAVGVSPFVVFAPVWDQSPDSSLNFCMPEVLANEVYRNISRLWILKKCRKDGTGKSFELVSKTRLVGPADAPEGERMRKVVIAG